MSGRYTLIKTADYLSKRFNVKIEDTLRSRYNVAPGQFMPVITNKRPDYFSMFQWGLIPNWSLDDKSALNLINAKAEHVLTKSQFKQSFKTHRCLIPADGYFEWKKMGKEKVPFRITLADDEVFAFAGLWDSWENPQGDIINTFTIITVPSNELVNDINARMPAILEKDLERKWLDDSLADHELMGLLKPYIAGKMYYYKAHKAVNDATMDHPECIQPAPKYYPGESFHLFE